jgi:hypothetical protein
MKPYDPLDFHAECEYLDIERIPVGQIGIVRRWRVSGMSRRILSLNTPQKLIRMEFDQPQSLVLSFVESQKITFDRSTPKGALTLLEYAKVLETGSLVDFAVKHETAHSLRGLVFWCHVEYRNEHLGAGDQKLRVRRVKPDGIFAHRLAYVAKTDRYAAQWLRRLHHEPYGPSLEGGSSFPVVIDYAGDADRADKLDLECQHCHERFEVRGAQDNLYKRVPYSQVDPSWDESPPDSYTLLVYPDGAVRAFSTAVLSRIVKRLPQEEHDKYIQAAELPPIIVETIALSEEQIGCHVW